MQRALMLLQTINLLQTPVQVPTVFLIAESGKTMLQALALAEILREQGWSVLTNTAGGSFKNQFKKADKSGAAVALIMGETECVSGTVSVKWLRQDKPQLSCRQEELNQLLQSTLLEPQN